MPPRHLQSPPSRIRWGERGNRVPERGIRAGERGNRVHERGIRAGENRIRQRRNRRKTAFLPGNGRFAPKTHHNPTQHHGQTADFECSRCPMDLGTDSERHEGHPENHENQGIHWLHAIHGFGTPARGPDHPRPDDASRGALPIAAPPRIRQRVFLRSRFRVVHGDGASHPVLPLREGQPWDFREDFGEARGWRVESVNRFSTPAFSARRMDF